MFSDSCPVPPASVLPPASCTATASAPFPPRSRLSTALRSSPGPHHPGGMLGAGPIATGLCSSWHLPRTEHLSWPRPGFRKCWLNRNPAAGAGSCPSLSSCSHFQLLVTGGDGASLDSLSCGPDRVILGGPCHGGLQPGAQDLSEQHRGSLSASCSPPSTAFGKRVHLAG